MTEQIKVKLSKEGQITIPKQFFDELQLEDEVTVQVVEGGLLIKPIYKISESFAEQLKESLVAKGLSGQELEEKLKEAIQSTGWTVFHAKNDNNK
nr:AbrB/MazE/SpoVT family DNA-binding domain-containing protein [Lysinibacillus timonensis]